MNYIDLIEKLSVKVNELEREVKRLQIVESSSGGVTDHGALTGLGDNDHPQYLLTTAKASDSDKLDGNDSEYFQKRLWEETSIDLGYNRVSDGYAYIDFHSIADQKDYDSRIIASGGTGSVQGGNLNYQAAEHYFYGLVKNSSGVEFLATPTWATYYPTPTPSVGAFTSVSCYQRYITVGKMRTVNGLVYVATNGTASGVLYVPLPTGNLASNGGGYHAGTGVASDAKTLLVRGDVPNRRLEIMTYSGGSALGVNGISFAFSITYEIS